MTQTTATAADAAPLPFPTAAQEAHRDRIEQGRPCRSDCGRCAQCVDADLVEVDETYGR